MDRRSRVKGCEAALKGVSNHTVGHRPAIRQPIYTAPTPHRHAIDSGSTRQRGQIDRSEVSMKPAPATDSTDHIWLMLDQNRRRIAFLNRWTTINGIALATGMLLTAGAILIR